MTLDAALREARARLARAGVPSPGEEAERLAAACLGCNRASLFLCRGETLDAAASRALAAMVARRERREPLAYVLGRWPFLDLELATDARALVPRPETEDVALAALERLSDEGESLAIDVGTGSGCVALALAAARPRLRVVATDRSRAALTLAAENARATGFHERVAFVEGDLVEPLRDDARADVIVANLPYVAEDELEGLAPEVREHEPRTALVAAEDGLAAIASLAVAAPARLAEGGWLILEIAPQRADAVRELLSRSPWNDVGILPDRFGRPRIALARAAWFRAGRAVNR